MPIIHAHRRPATTKVHPVRIVSLGELVEFRPNEEGDVVAECSDEAAEWFLQTPTGYRLYEGSAAPVVRTVQHTPRRKPTVPPVESPYVLKAGDQTLDLRPLNDVQLREFCDTNQIAHTPADQGDALRDKIVAALKV